MSLMKLQFKRAKVVCQWNCTACSILANKSQTKAFQCLSRKVQCSFNGTSAQIRTTLLLILSILYATYFMPMSSARRHLAPETVWNFGSISWHRLASSPPSSCHFHPPTLLVPLPSFGPPPLVGRSPPHPAQSFSLPHTLRFPAARLQTDDGWSEFAPVRVLLLTH